MVGKSGPWAGAYSLADKNDGGAGLHRVYQTTKSIGLRDDLKPSRER